MPRVRGRPLPSAPTGVPCVPSPTGERCGFSGAPTEHFVVSTRQRPSQSTARSVTTCASTHGTARTCRGPRVASIPTATPRVARCSSRSSPATDAVSASSTIRAASTTCGSPPTPSSPPTRSSTTMSSTAARHGVRANARGASTLMPRKSLTRATRTGTGRCGSTTGSRSGDTWWPGPCTGACRGRGTRWPRCAAGHAHLSRWSPTTCPTLRRRCELWWQQEATPTGRCLQSRTNCSNRRCMCAPTRRDPWSTGSTVPNGSPTGSS